MLDHVFGALPQSVVALVRDILRAHTQPRTYDRHKVELIRRIFVSEHHRLQELLTSEKLGDGITASFANCVLLEKMPTVKKMLKMEVK